MTDASVQKYTRHGILPLQQRVITISSMRVPVPWYHWARNITRGVENVEGLDGVQEVDLEPAGGERRLSGDIHLGGKMGTGQRGNEILHRVEEADDKLFGQDVGAVHDVGLGAGAHHHHLARAMWNHADDVAGRRKTSHEIRCLRARGNPHRMGAREVGRRDVEHAIAGAAASTTTSRRSPPAVGHVWVDGMRFIGVPAFERDLSYRSPQSGPLGPVVGIQRGFSASWGAHRLVPFDHETCATAIGMPLVAPGESGSDFQATGSEPQKFSV